MARATTQYQPPEYGQTRVGEWSELRSELVSLLDQVETQVARTSRHDPGVDGLTERVRDLRHQVAESEPENRHRDALRSVQHAIDRFGERHEDMLPRSNPRDSLDAAIQQIKARHFPRGEAPAARQAEPTPRFDDMARSVESISDRLGKLEGELRAQGKGHSANIKEIADQVGQLSSVVELLAGAVGETGQVKRLEGQIAALAKLISDEQQADVQTITRRIDDVSGTVGRLAEMQKYYADRSDMSGLSQRLDDVSSTVGRLVDLQAQIVQQSDSTVLAKRLDDVAATVGRLADLQVQFADRSNTNVLGERLDVVNAALEQLSRQQADAAERPENPMFIQRLDDVTQSVARIAEIQSRLAERSDTGTLAQRIDDVTLTVGRLADLQVQVAQIVDNPRDGVRDGMAAIESGVRNIYDRIDTLERSIAVPSAEIEKITEQLSKITAALRTPQPQPQGLIELVDALHTRISDIEARGVPTTGLGADVDALRDAVVSAFEPRLAAMEQRLGELAGKLDERPDGDHATSQIEAQVRLLVARMDQTGEQLSGLARLYQQPAETPVLPDLEELADLVAARTAALAARNAPQPVPTPEVDFDEIERRVARVVDAQAVASAVSALRPDDALVGLESTIREVNDRLARLEDALTRAPAAPAPAPAAEPSPTPAPAPAATLTQKPIEPAVVSRAMDVDATIESAINAALSAPHMADARIVTHDEADDPLAPLLRRVLADDDAAADGQARDNMPAHPGDEAPLLDKPFADPSALSRALEAKNGPRKRHPGLGAEEAVLTSPPVPPVVDATSEKRPAFDPTKVERPPQPRSSLEAEIGNVIVDPPAPEIVAVEENPSRNTFIAAHRRAVRSNSPAKPQTAVGGSSLIGRAFARLQRNEAEAGDKAPLAGDKPAKAKGTRPEAPQPAKAADIVAAAKSATAKSSPLARLLPERKLAGDKAVPKEMKRGGRVLKDEAAPAPAATVVAPDVKPQASAEKQSFLLRHRQPILLGAAVVALACITINLINQRMAESDAAATPAAPEVTAPPAEAPGKVGDAALSPTPMAQQDVAAAPRVVPMVDSLETGSVASSFAPADPSQPMPTAFSAASALAGDQQASLADGVTPLSDTVDSPLKVEMPPASLGPEDLREAAANGDVRAQFEIAAIYTEGRAVPENLEAAAVWYERAAAQGFAPAQYRLGNLYENGKGVTKDLAQARLWYQRAAEAGNRMAMHNLAAIYAGGGLGAQQFDAAAKWFEEAASRGMKDSQFNLGMLYARGLGVTQDLAASYKWFGLAAAKGDVDAGKARDDVAKSLDAATVQKLNDEIAGWKPVPIDLVANFAPIGTWSKTFDPGEAIANVDVVKGVQSALSQLGYDVGLPDGIAGPKTVIAIRSFEEATGMNPSGTVNPRLLAVLGSQPV